MPIYKDKERGTWYFEFVKTINGVQYRKKKRGFKTKSEATIAEVDALQKVEKLGNKELLIQGCYDEFVENTKSGLKPSAINKYDQFKRNYLCLLENKPLDKITQKDISFLKNKIIEKGNSESHTNKTIGILRNFLKYCNVAYDASAKLQLPLMESFKNYNVVAPKEKKEEYLPPDEFEKILNCFDINNKNELYYYTILYVLYWTGLRIGELAALTPEDLKSDELHINKDYMRVAGVDYVLTPKTQNSIRVVYLDDETKKVFDNYFKNFEPKKRIFESKSEFLNQPGLRRVLAKVLKKSGLNEKYDIHLHSLRHSHASYLRTLGYDEFTIAARLGNTPKVSASTYIHTSPEEMRKVSLNLNNKKSR